MALLLEKETPIGVSANYWRIVTYQYDFTKPEFIAIIHGYISKEGRYKGLRPLIDTQLVVRIEQNGDKVGVKMYFDNQIYDGDLFIFPVEIDRTYLYDLLRDNVPFFCGAIDA